MNLVEGMKRAGYKSGNVIALTGTASQNNVTDRMATFKAYMKKYPQYKIVSIEDTNWDQATSAKVAQQLLSKYASKGGIQGAYGMADNMAIGIIQGAKQAGVPVGVSKKNGLIVTGSNCLAVGINSIKAGVQYGTGTQAPQVEAALAVKVGTQILNGADAPEDLLRQGAAHHEGKRRRSSRSSAPSSDRLSSTPLNGERDPAPTSGSRSSLADAPAARVVLEVVDLSKSFGPVHAVRGLSIDVRAGEVHAVCGHNGAGKSTLVKALVGLVQPDEGVIRFEGQEISLRNPQDAQSYGIALVNQELSLVPELSVEDNIYLGGLDVPLVYRRARLSENARGVLDQLGLRHVQLGTAVETLSIGERQLVEIARLLVRDARLLILDEPTATLSKPEIERVFRATRDLVAQGRSVIFVSHRLDEVFELCDRVTVLRDGRRVATHEIHAIDRRSLIEQMLGEMEGAKGMEEHEHAVAGSGTPVVRIERPDRARQRRGRLAHARERPHHGPRRPGRLRHEHDPPRARRSRPERLRGGRGAREARSPEHAPARRSGGRALRPERPPARGPLPRPDRRAEPDGRRASAG